MTVSLDSSIRHLPFGEHVGLFYNSPFDRAPALLPVMKSVVQGRELLVVLADVQGSQAMLDAWGQAGFDVAELRTTRRLLVTDPRDVLVRKGRISPPAVEEWFRQLLEQAMLDGFEGVRVVHDGAWVVRAGVDRGEIVRFASQLNALIAATPATVFSHFGRGDFDSQTLLGLLKAHPKVVVGQSLCENDYYVPPDQEGGVGQELKAYLDRLQLRQRVREELKSARDQFQSLVEHVPAGILMIQPPDGKPRFMNSYAQSLLGRGLLTDARAVNLSQRYQFLTREGEIYPSERLAVVRTLRERQVFRADDLVLRRPDGHTRYLEMMAVPIFDDFGELTSAVAIIQDVTDRRQVEEQLSASERRYRQLLTSASDAICVVNLSTLRFISVNDSFTRLLGYGPADLRNITPQQIIQRDGESFLPEWVGRILSEGRVGGEANLVCADGRRIVAEVRFTLVEKDPEPLALAIINDITERTMLERRLREYVRVEAEQRKQLEAILDTSPMGILVFDTNKITVAANPAAGRMLRVGEIKQYVGGPVDRLLGGVAGQCRITPDLGGRIAELSQDRDTVLANEVVEVSSGDPPVKQVLSAFTSPVRGDEGQFLGRVWILSDLTEERKLQAQLWQAQKMESIGTLAGGVAHDFNNILVGVLGHASLARTILQRGDKKSRQMLVECLEAIETSAERAASLTRELLAYARGGKYRNVTIDINRLIRDTLDIIRPSLSPQVQVKSDLQRNLVGVSGDPGQIHQVLLNLCVNAADAMPRGGVLTVKSGTARFGPGERPTNLPGFDYVPAGQYVCVEVRDTGPGMTDEVRSHIFEPFFSTKGFGRGLGLAAVYGIVSNHRGYISVDCKPGEGCCFRVALPAADQAVLEPSAQEPEPQPGHERILVIDENPTVRGVLRQMMTELGYRILEADDPARGLQLFENQHAELDLVILDLSGSAGQDDDTAARLREIKPCVPLLLTGGFHLAHRVEQASREGPCCFVQKPYKLSQLTRAIRSLCDAAAATPARQPQATCD